MSIDARAGASALDNFSLASSKARHAFRIAGAIALPLLAGEAFGWSLPFLGSIFALQLVAVRKPAPTIAMGVGAVLALAVAFLAASWLTHVTLALPAAFTLLTTLVMFGAFYAQARTQSPFWFMVLIAICMMPLVASHSEQLADGLVRELVGAMACGIATVWLMHAAFPDDAAQLPIAAPAIADRAILRQAVISTFTVMPLLLFLLWTGSSSIIVIMTALTLVQATAKASGARVAAALIAGNLVAGLVASLAYFLVTAVPSFWLLAAVVGVIALILGERIAAANEASPLFVMIASATLILLGTGLTPFMDTSTAFASRVTGVALGCAYCVAMLTALQAWLSAPSQP